MLKEKQYHKEAVVRDLTKLFKECLIEENKLKQSLFQEVNKKNAIILNTLEKINSKNEEQDETIVSLLSENEKSKKEIEELKNRLREQELKMQELPRLMEVLKRELKEKISEVDEKVKQVNSYVGFFVEKTEEDLEEVRETQKKETSERINSYGELERSTADLNFELGKKIESDKDTFEVLENSLTCRVGEVSRLSILIPEKFNKNSPMLKFTELNLDFSLLDAKSGNALKYKIGESVEKDGDNKCKERTIYKLEFVPYKTAENAVVRVCMKDYPAKNVQVFLSPAKPTNVSVDVKGECTAGEKIKGVVQITDEFDNLVLSPGLLQGWGVRGANSFEKPIFLSERGEFELVLEKKGKYEISKQNKKFPFNVNASKFDISRSEYTLTPGPVVIAGSNLSIQVEPKDSYGNLVNEKPQLNFLLFTEPNNLQFALMQEETSLTIPIPKDLSGSFKLFVQADDGNLKISNIKVLSAFPSLLRSSASLVSKDHVVGIPMVIHLRLVDEDKKSWGKHFGDAKIAEKYFDECVKIDVSQSNDKVKISRALRRDYWQVEITTTKSGSLRANFLVNGESSESFNFKEKFSAGPAEEEQTVFELVSVSGRKLGEPQRLEVSLKDKYGNLNTYEEIVVEQSDFDEKVLVHSSRIEGGVRVVEFTPKKSTLKFTVKCQGNSPSSGILLNLRWLRTPREQSLSCSCQ